MTALAGLVAIAGMLAVLLAVNAAIQTFVVTKLWVWFLVPAFGVPVPHWSIVYGLMLLIGYVTYQSQLDIKKEFKEDNAALNSFVVGLVARPLLALAIGAIVHSYVPARPVDAVTMGPMLPPVVVEAPVR
jgi:hypothetical protein